MIKNFIKAFIARLLKKNPIFFKTIQWAAGITSVISGTIDAIKDKFGELPHWLTVIGDKSVWISGIIAWIIARLPNQNPNELPK